MGTKNSSRFTPLIIAISVVAGILIGTFYAKHFAGNRLGIINGSSNKLNALLRVVDDQYVDSVDMTDLVEKAMPQILAELDPHSTYIPAQKLEEVNSELEGSFSGIGIQFTIQEDTIHVNSVIQGGPSEKVGLMAGDRIVMVNDSLFVGKGLTNEKAMRNLKGPKGTQVKLGVKRATEKELMDFTITRGDIPQNTIDAAYMLNDDFGYIQVSKFGRTSHVELLNAIAQLSHQKCKGFIIDLRGNPGGLVTAVCDTLRQILPEGLIVYTEDKNGKREEYTCDGDTPISIPLVVLVNENTASAAEIFTGAVKDYGIGTIVGMTTFGKGIVTNSCNLTAIYFRRNHKFNIRIIICIIHAGNCNGVIIVYGVFQMIIYPVSAVLTQFLCLFLYLCCRYRICCNSRRHHRYKSCYHCHCCYHSFFLHLSFSSIIFYLPFLVTFLNVT